MQRHVEHLPRIHLICDPSLETQSLSRIEAVVRGASLPSGTLAVHLRAKTASDKARYAFGLSLRALCDDAGAALIVSARADIAQLVGADGVHLPERALPPEALRRIGSGVPEGSATLLFGRSCHDREGLMRALQEGVDYAFLSPVGEVPDKPLAAQLPPLGIKGFAELAASVDLPLMALGDVGPHNAAGLMQAGAAGFAVRRSVFRAAEPAKVLRALHDELPLF